MAKRKILTKRLPQTPCTPEMYEDVVRMADEQGRSIAEIQRDAIALFLRRSGKKITKSANPLIGDGA